MGVGQSVKPVSVKKKVFEPRPKAESDDRIGSENCETESMLVAAVADMSPGDRTGRNDPESEGSGY